MYEFIDYAQGRLVDTVISIDQVPCYVMAVSDDRKIKYKTFPAGVLQVCSLDSDKIDLTPLPLGYVNFKRGSTYLTRIPQRRWKQGLDYRGIRSQGLDYREDDWFTSRAMLDCFNTKYPSYLEALFLLEEDRPCVAFSSKWAVDYEGAVFFRGTKVGKIEGEITLKETYGYLQEMLEESL